MQSGYKDSGCELASLVGVENLWLATAFQRQFQSLQTELRAKAVGELPDEHVPGEEIHDRRQVEGALARIGG